MGNLNRRLNAIEQARNATAKQRHWRDMLSLQREVDRARAGISDPGEQRAAVLGVYLKRNGATFTDEQRAEAAAWLGAVGTRNLSTFRRELEAKAWGVPTGGYTRAKQ